MKRNFFKTAVVCSLMASLLISDVSYATAITTTSGASIGDTSSAVDTTPAETETTTKEKIVDSVQKHNGVLLAGISSITGVVNIFAEASPYKTPGEVDWEARASATKGYENFGITDALDSFVNVREKASEYGKVIGKMTNYNACDVIDTSDDGNWYKIESGEVEGWVSAEFIKTGWEAEDIGRANAGKRARICGDVVNVRTEPSTDSEIWTQGTCDELYDIVDKQEGWVKILLDTETGYVASDYIEEVYSLPTAVSYTPPEEEQKATLRDQIVAFGMQYLGGRYVWGGETLGVGVDCSGFTMKIYENFGVYLTHYAETQASEGRRISRDELQKGDLVFYAKGGYIYHVAMYIGDGQVLHAQSTNLGIRITSMDYHTPCCYATYID